MAVRVALVEAHLDRADQIDERGELLTALMSFDHVPVEVVVRHRLREAPLDSRDERPRVEGEAL